MVKARNTKLDTLPKSATGISGFDEIIEGGLPRGRPTLVCGGAGSGKTLFAMEFLIQGAARFGEPGVFVAFEENVEDLTLNFTSLHFDLKELLKHNKLKIEYIKIERSEIEETGEYDLDGLFIRLGNAIDRIGAKRVVLDTLESLFTALPNHAIVRAELRRLFQWLKSKGVTAVVTSERGRGAMTRYGLEEYVADCVIVLDHRVIDQISTRRLRVVKYRGSAHGTNEYPFLIDKEGISVLPITSLKLDHPASGARISSGIRALDEMLGGKGYYRASSILLSGTVGAGKSSFAASFVDAACRRGERCLYFAFEESFRQIIRNMRSIGINLEPHVKHGHLRFHVGRSSLFGLEMHLVTMFDMIKAYKPDIVVVDPITDFGSIGTDIQIRNAITLLIDFLKMNQITAFLISFTAEANRPEQSQVNVSSLIDTWIVLRNLESDGERQRKLYVVKSRGMAHSNQVHSYKLTDRGIKIGAAEKDELSRLGLAKPKPAPAASPSVVSNVL